MAEEELEIILRAIDDASSTFESVGSSAQQAGEELQTAFEQANAEVERLKEELEFAEEWGFLDEADALEEQLAAAEAEAGALGNAIENLGGSGFDEASASAEQLEQNTDEADQEVQNLNNDLGIINSSMLMQLSEQVGQVGAQAEGMAQEMNTAAISVGQLATQTGIAEPQMVSLINNISNATFPNDEAMLYVKSLDQMGVSAENLGTSATNIDKINDAFGLGAQTTNSLAQELGVLGVDMNNVSSSFNALAYANSNTVGGMQNYYTFLRRYDSQFKELGFDVDQSSMIIAAATQKYGGGRAALSGLSSALEECNGDTRALEQALGMQAGSLDHASEITGQYEGKLQQLADEEAEHKTLTDQLGAAWEDISLSLSGVLSPLGSFIGLIGSAGSFALQINGLKALTDTMKGFNIQQTITNALEGEGAIARVASALGITTEAAAADTAAVSFGGLAIAEGAALWPILAIAAAIAALVVIVYEVGKAFGWWTDVSSMLDAIWAGVQRLWSAFINHPDVQSFLSALTAAWNWLVPAVSGVVNAVLKFFGVSSNSKFDVVRVMIDNIGTSWRLLTTPIRSVITVVKLFISTMVATYNRVRATISNIRNLFARLPGMIRGAISSIASILLAPFTHGYNGIHSVINRIKGAANGLTGGINIGSITNKLTQPFTNAYNSIVKVVNQIKAKANSIPVIGGAFGGEDLPLVGGAYGGEDLTSQQVSSIEKMEIHTTNDVNLSLDLRNVPSGIDETLLRSALVESLTSKEVLSSLVNNNDFQTLDNRAKARILARNNRARGV